jgi:hypothetical protein
MRLPLLGSVGALLVLACVVFAHEHHSAQHDAVQPVDISAEVQDLGESAGTEGEPPSQVMLGTSGSFRLAAKDAVPKSDEEELGEGQDMRGETLSLSEAAKLLMTRARTDSSAKLPKGLLESIIRKPKHGQDEKAHLVEAVHEGDSEEEGLDLDLGESAETGNMFRYTNGKYGGNGGKKKWLKCQGKCKGSGYGGYGFCFTGGESKPWGGCMAPGADPADERPPRLYAKNRISGEKLPRAHRFCKDGEDMWTGNGKKLVPSCGQCKNDNYFLVPNQHVKNKMMGTCFNINQYRQWVLAVTAAMEGRTVPLKCSIFTTGKGMRSKYFGNQYKDAWDSSPKKSPYRPRGFVCTTTSSLTDHAVTGKLSKGFRSMRVFRTTLARFVMCYTDKPDGTSLRCVKKKRVGKCRGFFMRNAGFDEKAAQVPSPSTNSTGIDWRAATKAWDKKALKEGMRKIQASSQEGSLGFNKCSQDWNERLLAVH